MWQRNANETPTSDSLKIWKIKSTMARGLYTAKRRLRTQKTFWGGQLHNKSAHLLFPLKISAHTTRPLAVL